MQFFDINIAPNTVRQINVPGSFVYYLSGSAGGADSTILMRRISGGESIPLRPGQAFRLGAGDSNKDWAISNSAGQAPIVGTLLIGDGEFLDNRITGSVEVIDGGKARTYSGNAFMLASAVVAAAGQYATVQLWNPAGSGKNLIVEQITFSSQQTGGMYLGFDQVIQPTYFNNGASKLSGGANGVGKVYTGVPAASLSGTMLNEFTSANVMSSYQPKEPIIVAPGWGLHLSGAGPSMTITASFEWYEEAP